MRVGSLFCGAGGFDLGFVQGQHEILWAIDNDPDCIETYNFNIGHHGILSDIVDIDFSDLREVDLIIGGFPCQGFSIANKHRSSSDPRNLLYREFVRGVKSLRPKYFLAENVRGILSLDNGSAIQQIVDDFASVGYKVTYKILNASDFGVPQNRVRVFILGIREDCTEEVCLPTPTTPLHKVSVGEALKGIPEPGTDHSLLNHIGSKYKITNVNFIGCRQTDPTKPCPTIIARGNGKGGVNAIPHPGNHRRMTVREQAVIQTFPLDFQFFGSMSSCYRQVGNAVSVKLAFEISRMFGEGRIRCG